MYAYNIVITGSSKGIGKALAEEFVKAGDSVIISSRNAERVQTVADELQAAATAQGSSAKILGCPADVSKCKEVAALADFASKELGSIDFWINNAGSNAYKYKLLIDQDQDDIKNVVETNVLGVMFGCKEAIRVMRNQRQGGHVFNMDGAGADGGPTPRFSAYGATKRSLEQLSKSLRSELKMAKVNKVFIHNLSPGMVTTDLLMSGADNKVSRFFINCLAERPETVAQELVPRIRAVPSAADSPLAKLIGGQYIRYVSFVFLIIFILFTYIKRDGLYSNEYLFI